MKRFAATAAAWLFASSAWAAPVVDSGSGVGVMAANNAFNTWQSRVSSFSVDSLTGLSGTTTTQTSTAGNVFTRIAGGGDTLASVTRNLGVISGTALEVTRNGPIASFTWSLSPQSNAFGFFTQDNDGGTVGVVLVDGSTLTYTLGVAGGTVFSDNTFWGISGLSSLIASVWIGTTDPGEGVSYFDNFVTGTTVPEPGSLALTGLALIGVAAARRRRRA